MASCQWQPEGVGVGGLQAVLWEFDRLHSSGEPPTSDLGLEKDNKRKNRYCDVLPFDYNCVRLGQERRYINASFLTSKDSEPAQWAYIATQVSWGICLAGRR